ncbi:MAG: precorrin-6y C5,15-methyltransferase (decarboxylating) subunit CbiE [Nitrospiraceae bacterium]|nr:MAG: precorrin-6y C5,15-methyltransferase (decarboxylating) subunit CbiE [Nitrospiraceae bacterium]
MNKVLVIGIGFRPLNKKTSEALLQSDVVLTNDRLLEAFKGYTEYEAVKDRIISLKDIHQTKRYIHDNYQNIKIALLAVGDPMLFGIGRVIRDEIGKEAMEVHPDLSSIQVAFARIREPSSNAFFMSLHGGPDPDNRRKLEYEITELPDLLKRHKKIAILTDRVNSPTEIAKVINSSPVTRYALLKMYVCEKLGYDDEKITEGTPEEIAAESYAHPNVVIIISENND